MTVHRSFKWSITLEVCVSISNLLGLMLCTKQAVVSVKKSITLVWMWLQPSIRAVLLEVHVTHVVNVIQRGWLCLQNRRGRNAIICRMYDVHNALERLRSIFSPGGIQKKRYTPWCKVNVDLSRSVSSTLICQYLEFASSVADNRAYPSESILLSICRGGLEHLTLMVLRFQ